MNENDIQAQIESELEADQHARVVSVSEAPALSPDVFESDQRETDTVEVDFTTRTARIVKKSTSPKLTKKVLVENAAPVKTVEIFFDNQIFQVQVAHGRSIRLDILHERLIKENNTPDTPEALSELETRIKHLTLAESIVSPAFSYQGNGEGHPIEKCSLVLLNALWQAVLSVNRPATPAVYQVKVRRGVPLDTALMLGESFSAYPLGETQDVAAMTDADIEVISKRHTVQRQTLVASMMQSPKFTLKGEGTKGAFAVEDLCEAYLQTLYTAYRVVNVPEAGLQALRRFQIMDRNGTGQVSRNESVDKV